VGRVIRPDPDHDAVCASTAKHLLVTAPPGTGKTFLTVRLAGQLAPHLPSSSQVLVLTFSNQARTQLEREAARQLPPDLRRRIEVTNYHRFFWRAVNAYRRALGLPMTLDLGSRKRRVEALREAVGRDVLKPLEGRPGLIEALAEHRHAPFQDDRTPDAELLGKLLEAVLSEQVAGRLVFDDLGALFWELLDRFPSVAAAYLRRFPIVVADEHQDASALQDAVARRLGQVRLVVFADPMQLIHGFRGASDARLDAHRDECDEELSVTTPHRWHGSEDLAEWLLAVRARLLGEERSGSALAELTVKRTNRHHGFNAVKAEVKFAVGRAFNDGHRSIAVLALSNQQVGALRGYLCREGFRPRQVGSADFEDSRTDIEQLPLLTDTQTIALHAVDRVADLIPTLKAASLKQAKERLLSDGVNLGQAGKEARMILEPLGLLYTDGARRYFEAVVGVIKAAQAVGHHVPRFEALRALQRTADALAGGDAELTEAISRYSRDVIAAAHAAPRAFEGLFVMTAHQAKGKEFDCVILADASQQLFPDNQDGRRLFYVAITRATRRWVVIAPDSGESPLLDYLTSR
jgi:superfamily I DNA/RNA helicase